MESNDSPEIPDRGETSDIPGLPSGAPLGMLALGRQCIHQDPHRDAGPSLPIPSPRLPQGCWPLAANNNNNNNKEDF